MNDYELSVLSDFKVHCPKYIVQKYKHKHAEDTNWTRFYYYKNKKKIEVTPINIEMDYEVTSTLAYNKSVFYKMTTMSNSDTFFDYYFKLKPNLPKIVIKSSNRVTKKHRQLKVEEENSFVEVDEKTGMVLVRFE